MNYELHHGDCLEVMRTLPDASVDCVLTDPPYPKQFLPLYAELAETSARLLKPSGLLAVMCGQSYLPELLNLITPYLKYRWTVAFLTLGAQASQVWPRRVISFWKPVFLFSREEHGAKWFGDVAKSDTNANDKRFHKWGQSESGMSDLLTRLTNEGDVVLDPFMGGGTTGVVCEIKGRRFIGIEKDENYFNIARERIEGAAKREPLFAEAA